MRCIVGFQRQAARIKRPQAMLQIGIDIEIGSGAGVDDPPSSMTYAVRHAEP